MRAKKPPAVVRGIEEAVILSLREGHREFLRFLSRRTRSIDEAEDILQDFYLKAIRSARTIKEPGALKGWLAQVLRRTLADYYRRASVRKAALQRLEASENSALLIDDDADRAVCGCLYRILPTMPPEHSQLIWQIDLLGQPRSRVARRLSISSNNLGVRLYRARRALRWALMRFCTTCPTHGFLNCACEMPPAGPEEQLTLAGQSMSARGLRSKNPKNARTEHLKTSRNAT
jgi:RNA polymerase sigma-70 factor (ECF subfamily)